MKLFLQNLQRSAEDNPLLAIVIAAGATTAVAKLIDSIGRASGSRAYAKDVNRRVRNSK